MMKMTAYQQKLVEENLGVIDQVIRGRINIITGPMTSYDDFYQVGCEALCRAAMRFVPQKGTFASFAYSVIYNAIIDYCRHVTCSNRKQTEFFFDCDNSALSMLLMSAESEAALSDIDHSDAVQIFQKRKQEFSGVAKAGLEVLELQMEGYTTTEIAKIYGTTSNNVRAWVARARKRLRADRELLSAVE